MNCVFVFLQVGSAKPAIDCREPPDRPHVRYKNKKALEEERRQIRIIHENLRLLNKTAEIMNESILTIPSSSPTITITQTTTDNDTSATVLPTPDPSVSPSNVKTSRPRKTRTKRPITAMMKRNTHILLQWFLRKFGNYVPWWAEVQY